MSTIGQRLRFMRHAAGMTQVQVAEAMGVAQNSISRLERSADARFSTVQRYAEACRGKLEFIEALDPLQETIRHLHSAASAATAGPFWAQDVPSEIDDIIARLVDQIERMRR